MLCSLKEGKEQNVLNGKECGAQPCLWWAGIEILFMVGWYRTVVYGGLVKNCCL